MREQVRRRRRGRRHLFPAQPPSSDGDGGGDSDDVDDVSYHLARYTSIMVFLIWAMRSDPAHAGSVWFGREHPAFIWPPPHALVDRWPPLWVPHSVRLDNVMCGARTWRFPRHMGRGDVHAPDEPLCRLITIDFGLGEVVSLVLIWSEGSRALHARTRRACLKHARRLRGGVQGTLPCTIPCAHQQV